MTIRSLALRSGATSAEDHRVILGALLGSAEGEALDRRSGLFHDRGTADLSGSDMTATIAPFVVAVRGASATHQGTYLVASTEAVEVELEDGPAEGDRVDLVGVVIRDDTYDDSGETEAEVRVVDPDSDETYLPLFEITVPQGATAGEGGIDWPREPGAALAQNIADRRDYTSVAGGVVRVPDTASRNRMEEVTDGTLAYVTSSRDLYVREGDAWVTVAGPEHEIRRPRIVSGLVLNVSADELVEDPNGGDYYRGSAAVTFKPGTFEETPAVLITGVSSVPGNLREMTSILRSKDGFTIRFARNTRTSFTVSWMAVERTEETIDMGPPEAAAAE
ncbi:hypothetical protein [Nocardiopsis sp. B62]|uniref:hypothetical protein n=1 Tax=Nocardiopsis sp. B62 TaxID=2824874 RepID=UPI001B38CB2B|nr:hypothetical protein [Nocardiopsis sp. B62]MBQ1080353.1 hypothetical protein [Nocardiopsis sp. B62]